MDKFAVIDLETTGHLPIKEDKIIEVGIVIIKNNQIVGDYSTLFKPNDSIPPFISKLTGIDNEDVEKAPIFKDKAKEIIELFDDSYLIAHNVPFDLGFLNAELEDGGYPKLTNPFIDTVEFARILLPQAPSFKLEQLADYLNIKHKDPHRALSDAYVTAELFLILKKKLQALPYETVNHLITLERSLDSHLYQMLSKRKQELACLTMNSEQFVSYHGLAFRNLQDLSSYVEKSSISFGDCLDEIYESNGKLEHIIENYEKRSGQREMSEEIFDAFRSNKHALIEAETGTGKSLAYLIPAIYESVQTNKRIIISTYTTQLQTQLLDEEVPLVEKLLPFTFKVALLKGKHHYISLKRFAASLTSDHQENYDIILTKAMILVWLTETITGDVDEIQLPASGYYFFKRVSADSEGPTDPYTSWFDKSYYHKARKKAQQADIIITNHALLLTDIFNEYKLLPGYDKAILDEAHHLEVTASKHYGFKLDYENMQFSLNQIGATNDGNWLSHTLNKYELVENTLAFKNWNELFIQTKYDNDELFRTIFQFVIRKKKDLQSISDIGRIQYQLEEDNEDPIIQEMAKRLTFNLRDLIHNLSLLGQHLDQQYFVDKNDINDLTNYIQQLQTFINDIEQLFLIKDNANQQVRWIEIESQGNGVYLYSEPVDVSKLLSQDFFANKKSLILTSATLTMRNSFSFIINQLGLPVEKLITKKFDSPFTYQDQVQLIIPNDFPSIKDNVEDFIYSACEAIISLAKVTKGRVLVLFTSYDMLKKTHSILRETLDLNDFMLIAQGISSGSRSRLKKNFQTFDQAILLGTSSFWEGVDIPGEDLSSLMIVRLPFQPPHHPVYKAKSNLLKEEGKSAFFELSLPNAVIRFKQGFGRLIRSSNDRGIVFICDARVIHAGYGKFFTESIPNVPITYDSTREIIKKASDWF